MKVRAGNIDIELKNVTCCVIIFEYLNLEKVELVGKDLKGKDLGKGLRNTMLRAWNPHK